jgi:hypothetical protein
VASQTINFGRVNGGPPCIPSFLKENCHGATC